MKKKSISILECIGLSFFSSSFSYPERLIYKGPPEGPKGRPTERQESKKERPLSAYQKFALGEHEVLAADRLSRDYVSQISGSVDIHEYSREKKNERFYQDEVTRPATLLLDLYTKNRAIFTESARMYIEENLAVLRRFAVSGPKNHAEFTAAVAGIPENAVYGPDGVLNLLLAFNRVVSKLQPDALRGMADPREQQLLRIDLRKRATRSVEVSLFTPEIKQPDISKVRLDIPGCMRGEPPQKRMKPDGTYEVTYFDKNTPGSPAVILHIDLRRQMVAVTWYWGTAGPIRKDITIAEFDRRVSTEPFFLHALIREP